MAKIKGKLGLVSTFSELYLHLGVHRIADISKTGSLSDEERKAIATKMRDRHNAFAPGGLVPELVGALEAIDAVMWRAANMELKDINLNKNLEDTEKATKQIQSALARYAEETAKEK